jgi:hypothetical protein
VTPAIHSLNGTCGRRHDAALERVGHRAFDVAVEMVYRRLPHLERAVDADLLGHVAAERDADVARDAHGAVVRGPR